MTSSPSLSIYSSCLPAIFLPLKITSKKICSTASEVFFSCLFQRAGHTNFARPDPNLPRTCHHKRRPAAPTKPRQIGMKCYFDCRYSVSFIKILVMEDRTSHSTVPKTNSRTPSTTESGRPWPASSDLYNSSHHPNKEVQDAGDSVERVWGRSIWRKHKLRGGYPDNFEVWDREYG